MSGAEDAGQPDDVIVVRLSKLIQAHGDDMSELVLKAPTTKQIIANGLPTLIIPDAAGDSIGVEIRQKVIARYIVVLASIPMSSVESLAPADFGKCQTAVMQFFNRGTGEA